MGWVIFQVAAKTNDEIIDRAGVRIFTESPDRFEEGLARDGFSLVGQEVAEEICLHDSQPHRLSVSEQFERREVDRLTSEGHPVGGVGGRVFRARLFVEQPLPPAEQPAQPGEQDREFERFGEIVVRADLEAAQDIGGAIAGCQQKDRFEVSGLAKAGDDFESIDARQHDVEEYGVMGGFRGEQRGEGRLAIIDDLGRIAFEFKVEPQAFSEGCFVFNDEDTRHRRKGL